MNNAQVTIVGNLIRDPKKSDYNNQPIVSFTVGVDTTMKKKDGSGYESNFYNVSCFGQNWEFLMNQLQKGTAVTVMGSLMLQPYEKDGETRQSLQVRATNVVAQARRKSSKSSDDDELPVL